MKADLVVNQGSIIFSLTGEMQSSKSGTFLTSFANAKFTHGCSVKRAGFFAKCFIHLNVNISVKEKETLFIGRVLYSSFDLNNIVESTKFAIPHK